MSTMYKMTNHISERITEDPNIASNIKDQDVSGYIIRTYKQMAKLFEINTLNKKGEKHNIPDKLATLVEIEVLYRKQKGAPKTKILKTLIDEIMDDHWDKIKAEDLRSFFLPIFNSDYIIDRKYLQDFEYKLNVCLEYYSKINPNSIPSYLTDDIIAFLHCVYYQNELPTRDYQKLLEIIDSGEV